MKAIFSLSRLYECRQTESKHKTKKRKGFTIIEVVLALAIAGLIFAMVFIALPALQKAQRDAQRKTDVGIVVAAVKSYMKNNRGKAPPHSGSEAGTGYGDEYGYWQTGSSSTALSRYLVDLGTGGVTEVVSVRNLIEKKYSSIKYRIENDRKTFYEYVTVVVGAKCPDLSGQILTFTNTWKRTDIAVVRYLERGYWYCQEV